MEASGTSSAARPARRTQSERRAETRRRLLDSTIEILIESGYAATTMRDIAAAAGVSAQTVFGQGGKAALLLACVDRAVVGDDEAVPLARRAAFVRLAEAPGRADKLAALRELARDFAPRVVPMIRVFADAAAGNPEIARAWTEYERRRRQDVGVLVGALAPWLREGLDAARAADIYWATFSHVPADSLMRRLGWSADEYAEFVADAAERLLLA